MDRLSLLSGEHQQDDQLLETDIMRFMAIIGIVFWIIFTIAKNIPLHTPVKTSELKQPTQITSSLSETAMQAVVSQKKEVTQPVLFAEKDKADSETQKDRQTEIEKNHQNQIQVSSKPRGIHLQFKSMNDLLELMSDKRVRIFCRARARGFDLFFEGYPQDNTVSFKGVSDVPLNLWEIQSGNDRLYFLNRLASDNSGIQSFPEKQVLVSFTDKGLEGRITQTLNRLQERNQNGILSIARNGDVMFQDFEQEQDSSNIGTIWR